MANAFAILVQEYSYEFYGHLDRGNYNNLVPTDDQVLKLITVTQGDRVIRSCVSFDHGQPHGDFSFDSSGQLTARFHWTGDEERVKEHKFYPMFMSTWSKQVYVMSQRGWPRSSGVHLVMLNPLECGPRSANRRETVQWLPILEVTISGITSSMSNRVNLHSINDMDTFAEGGPPRPPPGSQGYRPY